MPELPNELRIAMESGELTAEQLRELISLEAAALGLDFDQAVERARNGTLPHNHVAADIELLLELTA